MYFCKRRKTKTSIVVQVWLRNLIRAHDAIPTLTQPNPLNIIFLILMDRPKIIEESIKYPHKSPKKASAWANLEDSKGGPIRCKSQPLQNLGSKRFGAASNSVPFYYDVHDEVGSIDANAIAEMRTSLRLRIAATLAMNRSGMLRCTKTTLP